MGRKQMLKFLRCLIGHSWVKLYRNRISEIEVSSCENCGKYKVYNAMVHDYYVTDEEPDYKEKTP